MGHPRERHPSGSSSASGWVMPSTPPTDPHDTPRSSERTEEIIAEAMGRLYWALLNGDPGVIFGLTWAGQLVDIAYWPGLGFHLPDLITYTSIGGLPFPLRDPPPHHP